MSAMERVDNSERMVGLNGYIAEGGRVNNEIALAKARNDISDSSD